MIFKYHEEIWSYLCEIMEDPNPNEVDVLLKQLPKDYITKEHWLAEFSPLKIGFINMMKADEKNKRRFFESVQLLFSRIYFDDNITHEEFEEVIRELLILDVDTGKIVLKIKF
ncbi:MAG: hypothetical protein A3E87_05560 [Gammaproteobacteria bacterium RIFCSPHIGHO2_12_FULL_35_23]|nr:MAG: hypothetical protein A3E87_05560 [Gammaproteobacteria bacterium RIFCSPHIGHO2_12_FULL_35_23]